MSALGNALITVGVVGLSIVGFVAVIIGVMILFVWGMIQFQEHPSRTLLIILIVLMSCILVGAWLGGKLV